MSAPMPMPMPARHLLAAAAASFCLLLVGCGDPPPALVEISPAKFDFGRIRHGEVRLTEFTIRNNSDRAITIAKAEPNCGCFKTVPIRRRRLDPGQETQLKVRFESGAVPAQRLRGKFVHVMTDHPDAQGVRIPLEGHIFAPVALTVAGGLDKLYFGMLGSEESRKPRKGFIRKEPRFEAELDKSLQGFEQGYAIYPPALAPLFDVELAEIKDGYGFSVSLRQDATNPGHVHVLEGTITFRVRESGPGLKERVIPYTVKMHGTWPAHVTRGN